MCDATSTRPPVRYQDGCHNCGRSDFDSEDGPEFATCAFGDEVPSTDETRAAWLAAYSLELVLAPTCDAWIPRGVAKEAKT